MTTTLIVRSNLYLHAFMVAAFVLFMLLFAGCASKQPLVSNSSSSTEKVESTRESSTTTKDSVIGVPADSAYIRLQLACDSMGNAYVKDIEKINGERTALGIRVEDLLKQLSARQQGNGNKDLTLSIECATDSLTMVVERQKELIKSYESRVDSTANSELRTEYVKYVPDYYKNCTKGFWWLFGIDLGVIAIVVLYFVGKNTPWGQAALTSIKAFFKVFG